MKYSSEKSTLVFIRSDYRKERDQKRRIIPATKSTWLLKRTKSFIVSKSVKIVNIRPGS